MVKRFIDNTLLWSYEGNLELCRGFIFLGRFDFFQAGAKCQIERG